MVVPVVIMSVLEHHGKYKERRWRIDGSTLFLTMN